MRTLAGRIREPGRAVRRRRGAWLLRVGLAALALTAGACQRSPSPVFGRTGAGAPAPDGLVRVAHSGFRVGWVRPDGWADGYDAILGQFVGIDYRRPPKFAADAPPGRDDYALPEGLEREWVEALADIFSDEIARGEGLRPASGPGPGVLRARFVLLDLVVHAPLAHLPPDDQIWIDSAGDLTVVVELRDSVTGARLARFLQRDALGREGFGRIRATPGPVGYEARRIFRRWARNLRLVIEALRATPAAG